MEKWGTWLRAYQRLKKKEVRSRPESWMLFSIAQVAFSVCDSTSSKVKWYISVAFFLFSINYPWLTSNSLCIWGWSRSPNPPASASLVPMCASLFSGQFYFLKDRKYIWQNKYACTLLLCFLPSAIHSVSSRHLKHRH